jgi:dTDP-4-dehydrorhamnose 3,5-epimerase
VVRQGPADIFYKCDNVYSRDDEIVIRWNDPTLAIDWGIKEPLLAPRDAEAPLLADIARLPVYNG